MSDEPRRAPGLVRSLGRLVRRARRSEAEDAGSLVREALTGLRTVEPGSGSPIVIVEFPSVTTNPIQSLLLGAARAHGMVPVGTRSLDRLDELLELRRRGIATVLHLHWLDRVMRDSSSEADAARRVDAFLARLDRLRAAGGAVAWTVHNVLPHATRFEALEARLAAGVANRASVVHVMAARTAELTAPWYVLPAERILHVPHPSYAGVYPDHVSRLDARARLGIPPDALALLALGAIQPYKGLAELLDAWATARAPDRRLIVAGIAAEDATVDAALGQATLDPTILVRRGKIAVPDMQLYLRAADVAVLPYRAALNSGALLLALTFGLPVIVPAATALADLVDPAFAIAYGDGGPGLAEALVEAPRLATAEARAAATRVADAVRPAEISERFVTGLRDRLGATGT